MNGDIYVQGGLHGEDFPEVRERDGSYRLLTDAPTDPYYFFYPRNYIAPDGRLFGYDTKGLMYFVTTDGTGSISPAGQLDQSLVGRPSTSVMYRPGRILQISGNNNRATTIDVNGGGRRALEANLAAAHEIARQLRLRRIGGTAARGFSRNSRTRPPDVVERTPKCEACSIGTATAATDASARRAR